MTDSLQGPPGTLGILDGLSGEQSLWKLRNWKIKGKICVQAAGRPKIQGLRVAKALQAGCLYVLWLRTHEKLSSVHSFRATVLEGELGLSSVQFSHSVSDSLWPCGLQHARPPCPSSIPGVYPNSCPLSWWCHPAISSYVIPFSSRLQSFPASGSFPMSQFFTSGGQSTGVSASASVLPMKD